MDNFPWLPSYIMTIVNAIYCKLFTDKARGSIVVSISSLILY